MASTTITKLKASLSELITKVKAGEELIIIERGKTIAKIIPVRRDKHNITTNLYTLERAGLARIGKNKLPSNFWNLPRPKTKEAIDALIKERDEGR